MPLSVLMAGSVPVAGRAVIRGFIYLRAVYSLRAATAADAERLARMVADGLEVHRSFAPAGWETFGEPWHEAAIGLDMVEYRRPL
jgi:hypothetical protein